MSKLFGMRMSTVLLALVGFAVVCYAVLGCGAGREGVDNATHSCATQSQIKETCGQSHTTLIPFSELEGSNFGHDATIQQFCAGKGVKGINVDEDDFCGAMTQGSCDGTPQVEFHFIGSEKGGEPCPHGCKVTAMPTDQGNKAPQRGVKVLPQLVCYEPPTSG